MECPVCCRSVPSAQLEKHVNEHLDAQQIENDEELAKDVAATTSSPTQVHCVEHVLCTQGCDRSILLTEWETHCLVHELEGRNIGDFSGFWLDERERLGSKGKQEAGSSSAEAPLSFGRIVASQRRDALIPIKPGLISALRKCLLAEGQRYSRYAITSYADHFQSTAEDLGWGCGWRNIQMLSSFLLTSEQWRKVLFGGSGFVPTVSALQQWLELAWSEGFDPSGAEHFNWRIHGSRKWIGTTECAAILRFFGLYAQIADFKAVTRKCGGKLVAKKANSKVRSARFLQLDMEVFGTRLATKKQPDVNSGSLQQEVAASDAENVNHQRLVDWVWNYYTETELSGPVEPLDNRSASPLVVVSGRPPLYFQHQGHSRTIVGIQRRKRMADGPEEAFLLILDPSQRTEELAKALSSGQGWQKLIKRGVHTLRKAEYQLCYVEPGIACGEDLGQLKTLTSMSFLY